MKKHIVGIGHALTDLISKTSVSFLNDNGFEYGGMKLLNEKQTKKILKSFPDHVQNTGGSTANTMYHLSNLGHSVELVTSIGNDDFGNKFHNDFSNIGITIDQRCIKPSASHVSIICVTPDSERSMGTFINEEIPISDSLIEPKKIEKANFLYLESYLWCHERSKKSAEKAAQIAQSNQCKIIVTLSDQNCVKTHHAELFPFIIENCKYVFANHEEICALMQTYHIDEAKKKCQHFLDINWIITEGRHGATIISGNRHIHIAAISVPKVIDKTGAGDLFAAGFIHGLMLDAPLYSCGHYASRAASAVIQIVGARINQIPSLTSNR